VFLAVGKITK
jgi:hypothetical protein